jgi:mannitol repressor
MELSDSDQQLISQLQERLSRDKRIWEGLRRESDRGCALIGAEYLNERLLELLQVRALEEGTTDNDLKRFFVYEGQLGTFSARLKAVYLFGFISKKAYRDIDYIRKIRNAFAHNPDEVTFADQQVKNWCAQLRHFMIIKPESSRPREQFIGAAMALESILVLRFRRP